MTKLHPTDLKWIVRQIPDILIGRLKNETLFVAGGFIRSCITGEKINDIDLFTRSKDEADRLSDRVCRDMKVKRYDTDNAYTINHGFPRPLQFIHRWCYDNPETLIRSFDFTIAQAVVWYSDRWNSMCHEHFYADLAAKRLVYTSPLRKEAAGGSMLRVLKFYQQGYRITLPSLGAVMARMAVKVDRRRFPTDCDEVAQTAKVLTGLLFEVDPNIAEGNPHYVKEEGSDDGV